MAFEQVDAVGRAAEHARDLIPVPVRHLGGAVHFQHVDCGVIASDGAAGFQRYAGVPPDRERQRHNGGSIAERGIDVAKTLADDRGFGGKPVGELAGCRVGVQHGRQFLDLDHDVFGGVFGEIRVVGEHHRDGVADIPDPVVREDGLAIGREFRDPGQAKIDRRDIGDVGKTPCRVHAWHRQRRREIDGLKFAMGKGRTHHPHVQLVGEIDVGCKAPSAFQQRSILLAEHGAADISGFGHGKRISTAAARTALMMFW